jgi:hypothetical protein
VRPAVSTCRTGSTFDSIIYDRDLTSKEEEYRAKARECEERAEQTRDPFIKQQMIEIAQKWHLMAAYEEKYGR